MNKQMIETLESRVLLDASLVGDANLDQKSSTIYTLGNAGTTAIYAEGDDVHGLELYRSDGTKHGTYLLKDIYAGPRGSGPKFLATVNGTLFFSAYDGTNWALWKTDGTPDGTVKTTGGSAFLSPLQSSYITARIGSVLFYIGRDKKLWRTDGTEGGTKPLTDRIVEADRFTPQIAVYKRNVYFAASDGKHGMEVWRSNGTVHATGLFADLRPGPEGSNPKQFVATSGRLFFVDSNFANKQHLWKTDGQSLDIIDTVDIDVSGFNIGIKQLTAVGDSLYFSEDETNTVGGADSIWRVTSQPDSLQRIGRFTLPTIVQKAPNGGPAQRIYFYESNGPDRPPKAIYAAKDGQVTAVKSDVNTIFTNIEQVGDDLYFAQSFSNKLETDLWHSDGGAAVLIKKFPGTRSLLKIGAAAGPSALFITLAQPSFFDRHDTAVVWKSDGTTQGTVALKQFFLADDRKIDLTQTIVVDDRSYFVPQEASTGMELWVSDGTPGGTHITRDIYDRTFDSNPNPITAGIGGVYFATASSGVWIRRDDNGQLVQLVDGDHFYGNPFIGQMGGAEILAAQNGIWRSDGTVAGTKKIFSQDTGALLLYTIIGNTLYFNNDNALWKSDGTTAGTVALQPNMRKGLYAIGLNSALLFQGTLKEGSTFTEGLWRTDGTAPATKLLDLKEFVDGITPIEFNGAIYFFKRDDTYSRSLWKTDGTPGGTVMLKTGFGQDINVAIAGGKLFILSHRNEITNEQLKLWTSDGTAVGTNVIKNFEAPDGNDPYNMLAVGNRVYFPARDAKHGFELWTSVGTTQGTVLLKDIRVGKADSMRFNPETNVYLTTDMATDGTQLYFVANDGIHGAELWKTDATPSGTKIVEDILPGKAGPWPQHLLIQDNTLLFSAKDPIHGRELWELPLS